MQKQFTKIPGEGMSIVSNIAQLDTALKPRIIFVGFPCSSIRCYFATLVEEFPDFAVGAVDQIESLFDDQSSQDIALIIAAENNHLGTQNERTEIRSKWPSVSFCLSYEISRGLTAKHFDYVAESSKTNLLAMDIRLDRWIAAVRLMLSGGRYIQPDAICEEETAKSQSHVASMTADNAQSREIDKLTPRENEVLALVAEGMRNKIVAAQLNLSEHTVKLHMHHIFSKLGVDNRTQAAAIFQNWAPGNHA